MSRKDKLLEKARRNPKGLSFKEFELLLTLHEWTMKRQKGSHRIWISNEGVMLPIQPTKNSGAKGYQIKQFLLAEGV